MRATRPGTPAASRSSSSEGVAILGPIAARDVTGYASVAGMPLEYELAPAPALKSPRGFAARAPGESSPFVFEDPTGRRWRVLKRVALFAGVSTMALAMILFGAVLIFAPGRVSPLVAPRALGEQILTWPHRQGIPSAIPAQLPGAEPGAARPTGGPASARNPGATSPSRASSATEPRAAAHPSPGPVLATASPKVTPSPSPSPVKHIRAPRPTHPPIARF